MRRESDLDLETALERARRGDRSARTAHRSRRAVRRPWVALVVGRQRRRQDHARGQAGGALRARGAFDRARGRATRSAPPRSAAARGVGRARRGRDRRARATAPIPPRWCTTRCRRARARGVEVVLVDTAGRLHTKHNLMAELEKIAPRVRPHRARRAASRAARARRDAGPERRRAGARVPARGRGDQPRGHQARRHRARRRGARDRRSARAADQRGRARRGIDDWEPFEPRAFAQGLFE